MYLIHVQLLAPEGAPLPDGVADLVRSVATPADRLEHVAVHPHAVPDPVLGLYLLADGLADAESRAAGLCERAVASAAPLHGWSVARAGAPLVSPFYELELSRSGPAGRNRQGTFPST
ncbi:MULTISPECIES: hypothetical protein [unclassified Kitasatospora]|uniref:hypothetical protein n=1 Tax=unclassified Kitasatospora TaxID=2633591 RepID=UPI0007C6B065|nr:hypothetical protein [Kitasatospora sp. MY 5-36]